HSFPTRRSSDLIAALEMNELLAVLQHLRIQRMPASGLEMQQLPAMSISMNAGVDDTLFGVGGPLQDRRAGAIAEQDAAATVFVIGDSADDFHPNHQHIFVPAGFDESGAGFQCVNEP